MTHRMPQDCDVCETVDADDVHRVLSAPGREYPGVGGASRPAAYVDVCRECREKRAERIAREDDARLNDRPGVDY